MCNQHMLLTTQRKQTLKEPDKRCNGIASIYCGDSVLALHEGFFCEVTPLHFTRQLRDSRSSKLFIVLLFCKMVTEVGAAISDWDRDGRMWWLAGKTLPDAARFVSLYTRIITYIRHVNFCKNSR